MELFPNLKKRREPFKMSLREFCNKFNYPFPSYEKWEDVASHLTPEIADEMAASSDRVLEVAFISYRDFMTTNPQRPCIDKMESLITESLTTGKQIFKMIPYDGPIGGAHCNPYEFPYRILD